jgi:hypothetical protein
MHEPEDTMTKPSKEEMADAVASGKHRYDFDKLIGWQVALGLVCIVTGQLQTIPVGLALLALTLYLRNKA